MVLVRGSGKLPWSGESGSIGDLVVVGAGRRRIVYGRLQGLLSPELPSRLDEIFRRGGPEAVVEIFSHLGETERGP